MTHFLNKNSTACRTAWLLFSLLLPFIAVGQDWTQKSNGIYGANVVAMVSKGSSLFIATQDAGIFTSNNNGSSWAAVNTGLTNRVMSSLAVRGDTLFAGSFVDGVYFSVDDGGHWQPIITGMVGRQITSLAIHHNRLFAATVNGIFVSTDFLSWSPASTGLPSTGFSTWVNSVSVLGDKLIAGMFYKGACQSTDNGSSWTPIADIPDDANVTSTLSDNGSQFMGSTKGLFVSTNNGTSWTATGAGLPVNYFITSLVAQSSTLYAATYAGYFHSTDNGANWTQISVGGMFGEAGNTILVKGSDLFFGSAHSGVHHSANGAATADLRNTGLTGLPILSIAIQDNYLFASTDNGLYRSSDNGDSWELPAQSPFQRPLRWAHTKGDTVLAEDDAGRLYFTTDHGDSWTSFDNTGLDGSNVAHVLLVHDGSIYATTSSTWIVFPKNGNSWIGVNSGSGHDELVMSMCSVQDTLFAGTVSGSMYRSDDNGSSWAPASNGLPSGFTVSYMTANDESVIVSMNEGTFMTTNNGATWSRLGVPPGYYIFVSLLNTQGYLIGGTLNGGAFFSLDQGATWFHKTPSYTSIMDFNCLTLLNNTVIAGTSEGIWTAPLSEFVITGLEESAQRKTPAVYPVPFTNEISVDLSPFETNSNVQVRMIDMLGRPKGTWQGKGGELLVINTQDITPGSYVIITNQNDKTFSTRVLKRSQ